MLKKALWIVLIVFLVGFAAFSLWRVSVLGLPDSRLAILLWAGAGTVAAVVVGSLAGRRVWRTLQRRPRAAALFALIGAANLAVFHLLWGPAMTEDWGNPGRGETLRQAFLAVAAVFLLALSSYLLGYLVVRPRLPVRRGWWVLLIFLLYGSIPAGILTGDARFKSRGTISPEDALFRIPVPFEEAFQDELGESPRFGGNPEPTGEFTLWRAVEWPERNDEIPRGEVIQASGAVAVVDGRALKLLGYGLLPAPRSTLFLDDSWEKGKARFWDLGGRPLDEDLVADLQRYEHQTEWSHDVVVVLERPPDWDFDLFAVRLRYPAWDGLTIGEFFEPEVDERRIVAQGIIRFPVPGPMEFSLEFFQGKSPGYAMPPVQGATIELPWNRLHLKALRPHRLEGTLVTGPSGPPAIDGWKFTPIPVQEEKPATTAVFEPAMDWKTNLKVHAVLKDGTRVPATERGTILPVQHCEFDCALEEIAEFRISSVTHPTWVCFQLPGIPVFPEVNEGVKDILDLRYPVLPFENGEGVTGFVYMALNYGVSAPDIDPPDRPHEYWSVREVLNYYFSDLWYTRSGRIRFYPMPQVPILRKIMLAARG